MTGLPLLPPVDSEPLRTHSEEVIQPTPAASVVLLLMLLAVVDVMVAAELLQKQKVQAKPLLALVDRLRPLY